MKKFMLAVIFAAIANAGFAQSFSIGPKAGLNVSNYKGGNIDSEALGWVSPGRDT
jgi:hypothetical protein